jgi:hypothetical protein
MGELTHTIYRVTDGSRTVFEKKKYSVDFQLEIDLFLQNLS